MTGEPRYPLFETATDRLTTTSGLEFDALTVEAIVSGDVNMAEFRITAGVLHQQAAIARQSGRATLARNFERAADLVDIPDEVIFEIYELLRPGRAESKQVLCDLATRLRDAFGASEIAAFIEQAALAYEARSLYRPRF